MSRLDLHALANLRGFGGAKHHLIEAGCWLEMSEDGIPKWSVTVEYVLEDQTDDLVVEGLTEEEARRAAVAQIEERFPDAIDIEVLICKPAGGSARGVVR